MNKEASLARDLACRFMVWVATLEAGGEAALTDGLASEATARPRDSKFTSWTCTPLKLSRFTNTNIFFNHLVLLLDLGTAEFLYLFESIHFLAAREHTWKLHSLAIGDFDSKMIALAVDTVTMPTFKREKVAFFIITEAYFTEWTFIFTNWISRSIHKILIEIIQ